MHSATPFSTPSCEVAVVIPSYNAAGYLARALDSVLAQTHTELSFCVVDDGSIDETARICESYSNKGTYLRQERAGQAAARNRGIKMSTTPYIAFLDADDYWYPEKVERQIAVLKKNPSVGLVCCDCRTMNGGRLTGSYFQSAKVPRTGKLFELLARECFIFTPTVIVRRKCLEEVGLFNEALAVSEDYNLWLRIAARWEIAVIPEALAVREKRPEGLSLTTRPEIYLKNGIAALENVQQVCTGLTARESHALQCAIAERYYVYGSYLLASGGRIQSREKFIQTLQLQPAHLRARMKLGLSFLPGAAAARLKKAHEILRGGEVPKVNR